MTFFFFNFIYLLLFIYGCVGSSFLCEGFLQLQQAGATLHRDARASHYHGLSCCGAQAPDAQAQQLWLTGPVAPRHVGSSQTRTRTRVPCIGRQILNHCATREARDVTFESRTGRRKWLRCERPPAGRAGWGSWAGQQPFLQRARGDEPYLVHGLSWVWASSPFI